ncbi:hypothetical protein [Nitrososphaera sp.]|uniref:hypothetical protein n=1 Tax=Nitrososphaera sp. TaxID=1971748 RepID=UPI002ED90448
MSAIGEGSGCESGKKSFVDATDARAMDLRDENGKIKSNVLIGTVFSGMLVAMVPAVMAIGAQRALSNSWQDRLRLCDVRKTQAENRTYARRGQPHSDGIV